jgi:hypothetical protein
MSTSKKGKKKVNININKIKDWQVVGWTDGQMISWSDIGCAAGCGTVGHRGMDISIADYK